MTEQIEEVDSKDEYFTFMKPDGETSPFWWPTFGDAATAAFAGEGKHTWVRVVSKDGAIDNVVSRVDHVVSS
jgi:hypothetical protein